ncbi:MAG: glycosyltransferase [Candidatus Nomurabacteria bacterium]|nr:MAG: glycosyltransferase [Candidatus Nomurabacteria bacterium]
MFKFSNTPKDYFLCIGRLTEVKGIHLAIEAAKATNSKLVIAGKSYANEGYWQEHIEPHIDGTMISYVGEADLERKNRIISECERPAFPNSMGRSIWSRYD